MVVAGPLGVAVPTRVSFAVRPGAKAEMGQDGSFRGIAGLRALPCRFGGKALMERYGDGRKRRHAGDRKGPGLAV